MLGKRDGDLERKYEIPTRSERIGGNSTYNSRTRSVLKGMGGIRDIWKVVGAEKREWRM